MAGSLSRTEAAIELQGSQYGEEGSKELFERMKDSRLVAVFGSSDDLIEFRGAIYDEVGAYGGGTAWVNQGGLVENDCDNGDCPHHARILANSPMILARWCAEPDISWTYETTIPHSPFEVFENDEIYCRGIVFSLDRLEGNNGRVS